MDIHVTLACEAHTPRAVETAPLKGARFAETPEEIKATGTGLKVLKDALARLGALLCFGAFVGLYAAVPAHADVPEDFSRDVKGSLLIVGGGDTPDDVQQKFVALARRAGPARIAILPMADTEADEEAAEVIADFRRLGAAPVLFDIRKEQANDRAVVTVLENFDGYWFTGGDQSRLAEILVGSRALRALERRYREGAVVGGTSAGASIMSGVMLTGRWRTPTNDDEAEIINVARGMVEVSEGFGFIRGAIVDQHFMNRARYNRLLSAVLDHPQLLGVGIDEETALLVRPDGAWEVLGKHYVKIIDARRAKIVDIPGPLAKASDIRLHILPAGSTFDALRRRSRLQVR